MKDVSWEKRLKTITWTGMPKYCTQDPANFSPKKDNIVCLCDKECMDAETMKSVIMRISNKLKELLQSACVPYRMIARKSFVKPADTTISPGPPAIVLECKAKQCLTSFPKNCNCIRKPEAGTPALDASLFKCQHEVRGLTYRSSVRAPGDPWTTMTATYGYRNIDSDCCAVTSPCSEDWFNGGKIIQYPFDNYVFNTTQEYYNIWHYNGWQMMGQIHLSDYIQKYFGFAWNPVPSCCHGSDCLGQWHFEMLWRISQALLRGHYDQYQGSQQQMKVIYRFGM
jgi:hypothetical protein